MSNKINIDEREASAKYGPSVYWFRRARWAGGGPPFIKLAGRVLYRVEDLDTFFFGRIRRSTADPGPAAGGQR